MQYKDFSISRAAAQFLATIFALSMTTDWIARFWPGVNRRSRFSLFLLETLFSNYDHSGAQYHCRYRFKGTAPKMIPCHLVTRTEIRLASGCQQLDQRMINS